MKSGDNLKSEADETARISVVKPENITSIWPVIFPLLKPAIDEDFWTDEQTLKGLLVSDKALLFVATVGENIMGAAVTQVEDVRERVVNIVSLGGSGFEKWGAAMNEAITFYAQHMKAARIVALGRKGWLGLWPDFVPGKILFSKQVAPLMQEAAA